MRTRGRSSSLGIQPTNSLTNKNNHRRRRSSIFKDLKKNIFDEQEPVLNLKPDLTTSVKESVKHEQKMEDDTNKILETTQIYAGEDMGNIKERDDIIENIKNEYSKDELVDIFKKTINGLDNRQKKNLKNNRNANS